MKSKINFVTENTWKSLIKMVMPLLCAMILMMAYNLVDSLWVGNLLGESGYAALTNSTSIVLILSAIAMGASNGISILVSQIVGAGKKKEADGVISTLVVLSIFFSIIVTIILELCLKQLLIGMNTPDELFANAYDYLFIYLIGYFAIYLYLQFTAVFRSFGDPIFQMKGMLISTIFNAILDPIMIHYMGLRGAAWATVLSECLCLLFAFIYYKQKKLFHIGLSEVRSSYVFPLLKDAFPAAIQGCMPAISSATMLILVTRFGVSSIAAYGVTNKLEILLFYPAMAMNMGLTTIVGQCMGARRLDRVNQYMKSALGIGCAFTAICSILVILFAGNLSRLFVDSSQAAIIVKEFFSIVSIGYICYMITSCFLANLSGIGKPGMSMVLFFVYYIVIRIPLAIVLVKTSLGLNGIWIAILVSHLISAVLASIQGICINKKIKESVNQDNIVME